jgi:hypothetical protein
MKGTWSKIPNLERKEASPQDGFVGLYHPSLTNQRLRGRDQANDSQLIYEGIFCGLFAVEGGSIHVAFNNSRLNDGGPNQNAPY